MKKLKHLSRSAKNAILFAVLGVLLCVAFLLALHAWEKRQYNLQIAEESRYADVGQSVIYLDGKEYRERKHLETVLLIGLDKFGSASQGSSEAYSNDQQSDFLMLVIIDRKNNTYTPLHINRDSMAPVQILGVGGRIVDTVTEQLALAHTYGSGKEDSCRNTVKAVSDFLYGIEVDHYISFRMDAVGVMNDLVGGVTLEIRDDFSAEDASLIQGQTVRLNGEQALHYVRARQSMEDSTNVARMERQRQYLRELQVQTLDCLREDENFAARALANLSEYITSDCTVDELSELLSDTMEYGMAEFETIPGEAVKGETYMEFYPDEQKMRDLMLGLFFEEKK